MLARAFPFLPDLPEVGGVRPRVTFSQGQLDQGLYPSPHAPVHLMSLCLVLLRNKPLYPPTPPRRPPCFFCPRPNWALAGGKPYRSALTVTHWNCRVCTVRGEGSEILNSLSCAWLVRLLSSYFISVMYAGWVRLCLYRSESLGTSLHFLLAYAYGMWCQLSILLRKKAHTRTG